MNKLVYWCLLSLSLKLAQAQTLESIKNFISKNKAYYPEQTREFIIQRLENCDNVHSFIRSFIPFYYYRFNELAFNFRNYQNLKSFKGLILGDAHVENFGFLTTDKNKLLFGFNDLDDVAKAPYITDLYRHYVSTRLSNVEISLEDYVKIYQLGINEKKYTYGNYFNQLKNESTEDIGKLSKKYVDLESKKFKAYLGSKNEVSLLSASELSKVSRLLKTQLGKEFQVLDSYRYFKVTGGSASMDRIELLINSNGKIEWIELKEQQASGLKTLADADILSDSIKIEHINKIFFDKQLSNSFKLLRYNSKVYLLRFRKSSNKGIEISEVSSKEREILIYDEVYTLGRIHALSLKNPVKLSLTNSIDEIDLKQFDKETKLIINQMKVDFEKAKEEI